ncbi:hypothetical protein F3Y22_tig00110050pilonHSYRG00203 [Hibiscus syriacus]|uniref:Uncharacterized protein n=1 Tax=Hibiscus syriacus TaxID=106335 RepID=A0A6A3BK77_HIBSY|nr:hypothetical protein F3Y22_tig00110050pilonHSYRG00203 [Hibiscus syriacus]
MGIGLVFSIFAMIIAVGCAEVFILVGQLEFFYDQAPDAMRSLCSALSLTTDSLGNYLSTVLVITVTKKTTQGGKLEWISDNLNRGHLHYFYLLALLNLLNFLDSNMAWESRVIKYKATKKTAVCPSVGSQTFPLHDDFSLGIEDDILTRFQPPASSTQRMNVAK